jgi:integrase
VSALEQPTLPPPAIRGMTFADDREKIRAMNDHSYALDLWISSLAVRGLAEATRNKYREVGYELADYLDSRQIGPHQFELDHARGFLVTKLRQRPPRRWQKKPLEPVSNSTLALYVSVIRSYARFLADEQIIDVEWAHKLDRPKRPRPEDVDVVTTSRTDVVRLIGACDVPHGRDGWDEVLCIGTLTHLGWRRNAASQIRREDVDLEEGLMRAVEKGGKVIWKPIPDELLDLYRSAEAAGVWLEARDFLIPNRRPTRIAGVRSNKVVYAIVKRVAAKARVSAHPHALRAAFAVQFDEQHPDLQHTLQILMGHSRPETTQIYLRRKNKAKAMEANRDLSFGFPSSADVPPAGFEPALPTFAVGEPLRRKLAEAVGREARNALADDLLDRLPDSRLLPGEDAQASRGTEA